jgi:hypothetical protein
MQGRHKGVIELRGGTVESRTAARRDWNMWLKHVIETRDWNTSERRDWNALWNHRKWNYSQTWLKHVIETRAKDVIEMRCCIIDMWGGFW